MSKTKHLSQLRCQLARHLVSCDQIRTASAVPTGCPPLDQFFLWSGWPKGEVSLIYGSEGLGPTALWLKALPPLTQRQLWAAWVSPQHLKLCPWGLFQKDCDLSKIFVVEGHRHNPKQWLWIMGELLSTSLFEIIGCHWDHLSPPHSQIQKLRKLAQRYQCSIVILSQQQQPLKSPFYATILRTQGPLVEIERALHRPTPKSFQRRVLYADLMPQLSKKRKAIAS